MLEKLGIAMSMRISMIEITISSSINVKPPSRRRVERARGRVRQIFKRLCFMGTGSCRDLPTAMLIDIDANGKANAQAVPIRDWPVAIFLVLRFRPAYDHPMNAPEILAIALPTLSVLVGILL